MSGRPTNLLLGRVALWLLPLVAALTLVIYRKAGGTSDPASLFLAALASCAVVAVGYVLWHLPTVYMFSAGLLLSIFSGNWQSLGLPGFPFLPDRFLVFGSVLLLVVRERDQLRRFRLTFAHVLLVGTVLYAVVSAAADGTLGNRLASFALLDQLGIVPFLMFFVVPLILREEKERRVLLYALVGLGLYLGVEALLETASSSLVFPHYIIDPNVGTVDGRVRGPFAAPVTEGFALFACAAASAVTLTMRPPRLVRLAAWGVIPLCLLGCFLTLERGVWIGTVASIFVVGVLTRELRRTVLPILLIGAVLVLGALVFVPGLQHRAASRSQTALSVWDRKNQDAAAIRMIEARPLVGFGWDSFAQVSLPYFRQARSYPMTGYGIQLHNVYLSNAVELGLIGFFLWLLAQVLALGGTLLRRGPPELRAWKIALAAMIIFTAIVALFNPLQQNFAQLLLWSWAGVIVGGSLRPRPAPVGGPAATGWPGAAIAEQPDRLPFDAVGPARIPELPLPAQVPSRTVVLTLCGIVAAAVLGFSVARTGGTKAPPSSLSRPGAAGIAQPSLSYAATLNHVITKLDAVRSKVGRRLTNARDAHAQATAANGLALAHFEAAAALQSGNPGIASGANRALISALHLTGSAYGALARAAASNSARGYSQATASVKHADAALSTALAQLRALGYAVG